MCIRDRDYILSTIIRNYAEDAALVLSTHLMGDIENVLDDALFLQNGRVAPVSYTHLDVYKRQAVERSGGQIGTYETKVYGTPDLAEADA